MNQSPILRRTELPAYLKISMPTVDRMLRDNVLPKIQITQKLVGVLKTDVDAYLLQNRSA
jgi:excisionase family DNA binding protein